MFDLIQTLIGGRRTMTEDEWDTMRARFADGSCWDCGGAGQLVQFTHIKAMGFVEKPPIPIVDGRELCGSCNGRGRISRPLHMISEEELP